MDRSERIVAVFGSAFPPEDSSEYAEALEVGRLLASSGYIVCNGGYGGAMEASARGAKEAGGHTIGVVTEVFGAEANRYINETIVTKTLGDRLLRLLELGNAYVVLRGGTGTLAELASAWEYMNKGILPRKPLVAVGGLWSSVVTAMSKELLSEGREYFAEIVTLVPNPRDAVEAINRELNR